MIGEIVVVLIVAAIVGSYMTLVNGMLRSDEYWSESSMVKSYAKAAPAPRYCATSSPVHA